jgi:hypothetical protein
MIPIVVRPAKKTAGTSVASVRPALIQPPVIQDALVQTRRDTAKRGFIEDRVSQIMQERTARLDALQDATYKFADTLRRAGAPALATLLKAAETRRDAATVAVLNSVRELSGYFKTASADNRLWLSASDEQYYKRATEIAELAKGFVEINKIAQAAVDSRQKFYDDQRYGGVHPVERMRLDMQSPAQQLGAATIPAMHVYKTALFDSIANKYTHDMPNKETVDNYAAMLDDTAHERQLRAIRARAMFEMLRTSDPVLAGHDPAEVAEGYNVITKAMPHAADKELVMQAALRRYLGQGNSLSSDDIRANILDTDNTLRQQEIGADRKEESIPMLNRQPLIKTPGVFERVEAPPKAPPPTKPPKKP